MWRVSCSCLMSVQCWDLQLLFVQLCAIYVASVLFVFTAFVRTVLCNSCGNFSDLFMCHVRTVFGNQICFPVISEFGGVEVRLGGAVTEF